MVILFVYMQLVLQICLLYVFEILVGIEHQAAGGKLIADDDAVGVVLKG